MCSLLFPVLLFLLLLLPFVDSTGYRCSSSMDKSVILLYIAALAASFRLVSSSSALCPHESDFFRYSLQSQCPISISPHPPLKVCFTLLISYITDYLFIYLLIYCFFCCWLCWLLKISYFYGLVMSGFNFFWDIVSIFNQIWWFWILGISVFKVLIAKG